MSLWVRYDPSRAIWEIASSESGSAFADLLENHPREVEFSRWIDFNAFTEERVVGAGGGGFSAPLEIGTRRRTRGFIESDFNQYTKGIDISARPGRRRKGWSSQWGPGTAQHNPRWIPLGTNTRNTRIFHDAIRNRIIVMENSNAFHRLTGWALFNRAYSGTPVTGVNGSTLAAETQLSAYTFTIPAYTLNRDGDNFEITATLSMGAASGTKTFRIYIGSGTAAALWSSTTTTAAIIHGRWVLYRRSATGGAVTGVAHEYVAGGASSVNYGANTGLGTVNWLADQVFKVTVQSAGALSDNALILADFAVRHFESEDAGLGI